MKSVCGILWRCITVAVVAVMVTACSSTRHVPQGRLLLDKVRINIDKPTPDVSTTDLTSYLRQNENRRVLGGMKLQLAVYNMSGHDSTKWYNRWIQRLGNAPVIYDSTLTSKSSEQLHRALINKGFVNNVVDPVVVTDSARRKATVDYNITLNDPYRISSIAYNIGNDTIRQLIEETLPSAPVSVGGLLDHNALDQWRQEITNNLRNHGYYAFNKDYITFTADTAAGSTDVDLTMNLMSPYVNDRMPYYTGHKPFMVRRVTYVTSYDPVTMYDHYYGQDTCQCDGIDIYYGSDRYIRESVLAESNRIKAGAPYNADDVTRTYQSLMRLGIIKTINIDVQPVGESDGQLWVDAFVLLQRGSTQSVTASLEGTNSEGDLGFGIGLGYSHRNIFKGSETLNTNFRMSYESISGDLSGLINDNYSEYAAQVGVSFPKFMFPFLKRSFKDRIMASTTLAMNFNYQSRPEFTRVIAGTSWRYQWSARQGRARHTISFIDLDYVYLPRMTFNFYDRISNPLLLYSYEDHLIMRTGYNFYLTNKRTNTGLRHVRQPSIYTFRASAETAGNLLYAISKISGQKREDENSGYKALGIRYAQYFKIDADYSFTRTFSPRSSLAFRVGMGVAVPYGNTFVIPFEKRFYAGGANSVRGWGVRTLGPGSYASSNLQSDFIYQCGDIRFDASMEYRLKLFWVIEAGAFIDAGNIWTIRDYADQEGGVFKFNKFYEQIAMAYGLGIRLDFNYFLLRFDLGMKAFNPASGAEQRWPLTHPRFKRDAQFHFSVGYPF